MAKRILMPLGSASEHPAADLVRATAREQGSTVRLMRVMPVPTHAVDDYGRTVVFAEQDMASLTARGLADMRVAESQLEGVPLERVVRFGEPVTEILTEAEVFQADLIVLTTGHRSRLESALRPGVGERVLREADVPVLLMRE